jgi:hypothetical protein
MASALYPKGKRKFMEGSIVLGTDTINCAMVTASYTYSVSHEFWSSASANVVGTPQALAGKSTAVEDACFDANDVTFTAVSGSQVTALILYKDTGSAATSPLIAYIDSAASGLPVTPNGGNITVSWQATSPYIYKL